MKKLIIGVLSAVVAVGCVGCQSGAKDAETAVSAKSEIKAESTANTEENADAKSESESETEAKTESGSDAASGAAVDEAKLQELIDENSLAARLGRHTSVSLQINEYGQDGKPSVFVWWLSADKTYSYREKNSEYNLTEDGHWYISYVSEGDTIKGEYLFFDETQFKQAEENSRKMNDMQLDEVEVPVSLEETDGKIILVTEIRDKDTIMEYLSAEQLDDAYEYQDGMVVRSEISFDAKTKDLTGVLNTAILEDGSSFTVENDVYTYDSEENLSEEWAEDMKHPQETRTVTIVKDPDTAEETSVSLTTARDVMVFPLKDTTGEYLKFYEDRACTKEYATSGDKDRTLYVKKGM